VAAVLFSLGGFERGAEDAPQTGSNGLPIGAGQCAEPLRIPGIYRGDLRGAHDRRGRETGGAEIRYAYIVRPPGSRPLVIMTTHNSPCVASISPAMTTSAGRR
jgi:hypothetical protein